MNIKKEGDKAIIELDLWQDCTDCTEEIVGRIQNLVGIIAGDECSISQLIDMTYKGKAPQEGMPIINFDYDPEGLREACKILGLDIWEHPLCSKCKKAIRGCSTWSEGKPLCFDCDDLRKKKL